MNLSFRFSRMVRSLILVSSILLSAVVSVFAQQQATDGATPLGLSPGAPAGSYSLSNFEHVNLFNGTLNFSLPLVTVQGRGEAEYSLMLRIDHKWLVQKEPYDGQPPILVDLGSPLDQRHSFAGRRHMTPQRQSEARQSTWSGLGQGRQERHSILEKVYIFPDRERLLISLVERKVLLVGRVVQQSLK
jgi:hypothetical protein